MGEQMLQTKAFFKHKSPLISIRQHNVVQGLLGTQVPSGAKKGPSSASWNVQARGRHGRSSNKSTTLINPSHERALQGRTWIDV